MGPRTSQRRKVVVLSSDDEDEKDVQAEQAEEIQDETPKPQKRSTGKLKSVKNGKPATSSKAKDASPKQSPRKGKNAVKDAPKPSGRPIYSFFNSATQKQQASQLQPSPDKRPVIHDEVEAINDSDEEKLEGSSHTTLSKGSSTALAMRKRKFGRTQSFEDDVGLPPAASQKFRKASSGDKLSSFSVSNDDKRPWTEQFVPADLSELAVHKRKVADVRNWLEMTFRGKRQKVLVLKGPAGTGKTMTVRLLAKELGVELVEWRDPTESDYGTEGNVSAAARFEEFAIRAGKVNGLTLAADTEVVIKESRPDVSNPREDQSERLQALLVEEFPNTFSRTSSTLQSFRSTIAQYVSTFVPHGATPVPMIMVISETLLSTNTAAADSFTAHRLLGPELITSPYIDTIEFNPVAPTYLIKALEAIVVKEARKSGRRRTPGPLVLKHLAETGDIRSAVSSLEFLCLRGDDGETWSSKVTFTKTKSKTQPPLTKAEEEALKLISNRESSLGIFHSVGKVVYNKRTDSPGGSSVPQPPPWLPQHRRPKIPETDSDALIDELGTDTSTFIAALHENYALSCACSSAEETLDSLSGCMDNLSDSDLLSLDRFSFGTRAFSGSATDTLRQDELCFQVAVRGTLFSLPHPVHRSEGANGKRGDAFRMFYPASLKLWRKREEIEGNLDVVISKLAAKGGAGAAQSRSANSGAGSGVESWGHNKSFKSSDSGTDQDIDVRPQLSTEAKKEMLMDRLPYLAHILSGPRASPLSRSLREQVTSITRLEGTALPGDNDEADADEGDATADAEQWTTDRPDAEGGSTASPRKKQPSKKNPLAFEGITLPVESKVEKLVLEDDDIED